MTTLAQRSFSGGEISPSLYARVDTAKYATGLRTCRNFIVMKHGGASNRPGTRHIVEVKDSSKKIRKIPFIFNNDQTYVLEFGDQYMRVIRNDAQVEVSGVSAWADVTAYIVGDLVEESGTNYYCIQAHTSNAANDQPGSGSNFTDFWYALTGDIYEIPTPYLEADLPKLKYVQSADIITISHPSYEPRDLARTDHTEWTLTVNTFAPSISSPTNVAVSGSAGSDSFTYHVTAIDSETFEESLAGTKTQGSLASASSSNPHTITWTAVSGISEYNVYLEVNGIAGFIGVAGATSFENDGITPDTSDTPPSSRNPFSGSSNFPSTVMYYQQRLMFGNSTNNPTRIHGSRSGNFKNFTISSPLQDDDAVTFDVPGQEGIKNMIDLGTLIIFTGSGEFTAEGDDAGILLPTAINQKRRGYSGSADLFPLVVGNSALYLQARGSFIRDIFSDLVEGYKSQDLTIFSSHLFDGYTIVDWAYQQIPNSIVWAVRSDGVLLGLTYVREHQIWAWHRHDFNGGTVENVCVIPGGTEDDVYLTVKRTINGGTVRYIEKLTSRLINDNTDVKDLIFMDSTLTFDGRNTGSTTMTLSGGTDWTYLETLTLTASSSFFVSGDVGNEIHITGSDGTIIRCSITAFTSGTVVSVKPNKTVPVAMRNTATTNWAKAVDEISGLGHLEGEDLSIFGDGFVVANPNNDAYDTRTVSSGSVTLDKAFSVIHAGLPYICDIETLDIDTAQGESVADKKKIINKVSLHVESSRGIWAGPKPPTNDSTAPLEGLREFKLRNTENYDSPPALLTKVVDVNIKGEWNSNGRVFIRQVDPVPLSVLSVLPSGLIPFRG